MERSPLVSAIWHPLSPTGNTLVTTTKDACVRLWELDEENRASFDEPSLAIDLQKLANATTTSVDLSTSGYGINKGFSPDHVEMEVAATAFGGQGRHDEHGWASMTLWIAMTEGDVYALCPLLPARWAAPAGLLGSLSPAVVENSRAAQDDAELTDPERRTINQQYKWLKDVDGQEPLLMTGVNTQELVETYSRPERPGAVPRLQGPFSLHPQPEFGEITDVFVIAPKVDDSALFDPDDQSLESDSADDGLSVSVICLATTTNEVHICLDLDTVQASWLPSKRLRGHGCGDEYGQGELLVLESVDLGTATDGRQSDHGWPTFTASPHDRYSLFVTHPTGVSSLSLGDWAHALEDELASLSIHGTQLRLNVTLDSTSTIATRPVDFVQQSPERVYPAVVIPEASGGVVLLAAADDIPTGSVLERISLSSSFYAPDEPDVVAALPPSEPRAPYRPAPDFDRPSALIALHRQAADQRALGSGLKSQVRFSPATLQLITECHRTVASETHQLGLASADLFRTCERMRTELIEHIRMVAEIAAKVDSITGADDLEPEGPVGPAKIERRMEHVRTRNSDLGDRMDRLGKKSRRLAARDLSVKEKAFGEEVAQLESSLLPRASSSSNEDGDVDGTLGLSALSLSSKSAPFATTRAFTLRFDTVSTLRQRLVKEVEEAQTARAVSVDDGDDAGRGSETNGGVAAGIRKRRVKETMELLDRETALVDAVTGRLGRLVQGAR